MFLRLGSFTSLIFVFQDVICSSRAASALHRVLVGMLWIDRPVAWAQLRLREEPTGDARLLDPTCHATTQVQASGRPAFFMCFPASFSITISQNSATSPLQGRFLTVLRVGKSHQSAPEIASTPKLRVPPSTS